MKSIIVTYPDFQKLPKGLKQLLLASESFFFDQKMGPVPVGGGGKQSVTRWSVGLARLGAPSLLHQSWKN